MSTAEELLCSRKWRLSRGLWMLLGWVPLALTAWIGYLIIGVKARNWRWLAISAILLAYVVVTFVVIGSLPVTEKGETRPEPDGLISNLVVGSWLIVWLGNALGLQLWINRKWLVWRAHNNKRVSTPWYATATATSSGLGDEQGRVATAIDDALAGEPTAISGNSFVSEPRLPKANGASNAQHLVSKGPDVLDINTASYDQVMSLPGLDAHTAAQVIAARDAVGGFSDTTDLVTHAGVKPHIFAGLKGHILVSPAAIAPPAAVPSVPATEQNGRRLEF